MDGNGVLTEVYSWSIALLDFITILVKIIFTSLHALYTQLVPPEEKSVKGELVLITGTGHGIGRELAKLYGALGAEVICVDVNTHNNEETVNELKKSGCKAYGYACDVSKRENVLELGRKVRMEVGDVTILVNNAGIMPCKRFEDHTAEDIQRIFNINVFAHFWMFEAFLPRMLERNYGHIVGLSSVAGLVGLANIVPYCASKFAVRGMMEALAEELRHEGRSIGFTTVYPFMVDTGLCKKPRIKFPGVFKIQTPQGVASAIVTAQRRGHREITVPGFLHGLHKSGRLLPEKTQMVLIDFTDSGVDASD